MKSQAVLYIPRCNCKCIFSGCKHHSERLRSCVGDSLERDILPAKALGLRTIWLQGTEPRPCLDSAKFDIPIQTLMRSTPSSFHSLCELMPFLQDGPFLLSLVDSIFATRELDHFVRYAQRHPHRDGLLAVTDFVEDETPLRVRCGEGNRVIALGQAAATSPYVTGGIYWLSPSVLPAAKQALQIGISRMRNFLAFLLDKGYALEGYWFRKIIDVDTTEDIMHAERIGEKKEWNLRSPAFAEVPNFHPTMWMTTGSS